MNNFLLRLRAAVGVLVFSQVHHVNAVEPNTPPQMGSSFVATSSFTDLGRGVNIGEYLSNAHPGDWTIKFDPKYDFKRIRDAGFNNVRLPLNFSAHVVSGAPDYTIESVYLQQVDEVLHDATTAGLKVIIDDHNEKAVMDDPEANTARFVAEWKQVAEHFKDQPPSVYFELINEPINRLDAQHLNTLLAKTLPVVRATNPTRTVVVGPSWSYNAAALDSLMLPPSDRHLLVTIHYYTPLQFTHQGAAFVEGAQAWLGTTWTGTDAQRQDVLGGKDGFDKAAAWARANNRPMYLGEYGSYLKGPMESRARWTAFVTRTAEADGMSWSFYDYASGFGVCDPDTKQWIQPLLTALIPK